jgi:broad specificity phosphatase PhoE
LDSPLTERGVAQARAIGRRLRLLPDALRAPIASSPQPRARRTAELIRECLGERAMQVQLDERLCEVSIGRWEGLCEAEIAAVAPGTFEGVGRFPGGVGCAIEPAGFARVAIDDFGGLCWPGGFGITAQALHDHLTRETKSGGGEKIG